MKKNRAFFIDRDGIIIKTINNEAPTNSDEMLINKGVRSFLKITKKLGFINIIISNQPDIALSKITEKQKNGLEKKFLNLIKDNRLPIDDIYYCHHHDKALNPKYRINCNCRKPKTGMWKISGKKWQINYKTSYTLGDRASDIKGGHKMGTKTILLDPNNFQEKYLKLHKIMPDYKIRSLNEVQTICKR